MTLTQQGHAETQRVDPSVVLEMNDANLRVFEERFAEFQARYPGRVVVVANGGEMIRDFASNREMRAFMNQQSELTDCSAVVWAFDRG